jgi:hypothetical protein
MVKRKKPITEKTKIISKGHQYDIMEIQRQYGGKFYVVVRDKRPFYTSKIFQSKKEIERHYPNLKGKL